MYLASSQVLTFLIHTRLKSSTDGLFHLHRTKSGRPRLLSPGLLDPAAIAREEELIRAIQSARKTTVHDRPHEDWSATS
jgi:hypothetical protein